MSAMVRFFRDKVQLIAKSEELGRPYFEDMDFIEILIPGDSFNQVVTKVSDVHKEKYAESWKKYQSGLVQSVDGTPIESWSRLSRANAANYKAMNFHTIEQIAEMGENVFENVGIGAAGDKIAAKAYLAQAQDTGLAQKQAIEIDTLKSEVTRLTEEIKRIGALAEKPRETIKLKDK